MGVVIEICVKHPGGSNSNQGDWHTTVLLYYAIINRGSLSWLH
jgi:hypothetical protein